MKISVVYATNRAGGLDILKDNLDRQTFRDFDLIIADDLYDWRSEDVRHFFQGYPFFHFKPRQPQGKDVWNLNKAYNDCFSQVSGDLIVFLQDYIKISARGLDRFWEVYQEHPHDLVTGFGHKYRYPEFLDDSGKITCFKEKDTLSLATISEFDDRARGIRALVESDWTYYELNWASCPKSSFPQFEEEMDSHYGGENQIFALKTSLKGAKIYLDRTNECFGYSQKLFSRPSNWEQCHANKGFLNQMVKKQYAIFGHEH